MSDYVILAGPQAAGKSTAITGLNKRCQNSIPMRATAPLFPLQESRQIITHKNMLLGAIFMSEERELEVVQCDFGRMDLILKRTHKRLIYIDECNIFTIAHAAAHGIRQVEKYWDEYVDRLQKLRAKVIFLDVPRKFPGSVGSGYMSVA